MADSDGDQGDGGFSFELDIKLIWSKFKFTVRVAIKLAVSIVKQIVAWLKSFLP